MKRYIILVIVLFSFDYIQTTSNQKTLQWVKHGNQCLPPSKYYAGSCYTYMRTSPAPSWERASENCIVSNDSRLLTIESVDEYHFIERQLIGLKSGSESVSVYVGLRKTNNTWYWSNNVRLKETSVYRFWVDNNRDILDYDCGILWLARNTSVITPAPCVEQALRPYVCKQVIDRCYNNTGTCGKYGTCINLSTRNSYKCQCRFFYTGFRCEKWSSHGIQVIIGCVIIILAILLSCFIDNPRRLNKPKRINPLFSRKQSCSNISSLNPIRSKEIILCLLTILFTFLIFFLIKSSEKIHFHSKQSIRFCILYENKYYHHLITLPIAFVIIILMIIDETRRYSRGKFQIFFPIPFNPFSKTNRFDTMILFGILSHEILDCLQEIFLNTTSIKSLLFTGPLFDLIRQIGFISIIAIRYYPMFSIFEKTQTNLLYYILCVFYICLDFGLRIFQQMFCLRKPTNLSSFMFNIMKIIPFYLCLTYVCIRLIYLIIRNVYEKMFCCQIESSNHMKKHIYHEPTFSSNEIFSNEYHYVQQLFTNTIDKSSSILNKIYRPNRYFRYSKQILNIYMFTFILIYLLTFHIIDNGFEFIEKFYQFLLLPSFLFNDEIDLPEPTKLNFRYEIFIACLLTSIVFFSQLFFAMKTYQKHMLNAYQGIYKHIPSRLAFKQARLISKHMYYPGYFIGYFLLGYILIGNVILLILISLRICANHLFIIEELAKIIVPILAFYLMKFIIQWFICRTFFLQKHGQTMILRNHRIYYLFMYFNFFFDCFLGMISCFFRLIKSYLITFIYLPRLDYSPFGRYCERFDPAFQSYVSYIHMECLHTHPILIYFCSIIQQDLIKRNQYLRKSKRDLFYYTYRQRIIFRWWLIITLNRNRQLILMRKHRILSMKTSLKQHSTIHDHTITCTTLLLDIDDRNSSF